MRLEDWKKEKEYLICVDSDGCAMDTMNCKHFRCFGPCMVKEWELEKWEEPVLKRWNEINLFTMTRGINRFKGLALALSEIDQTYKKIEGLNEFCRWVEEAKELSNRSLEYAVKTSSTSCLKKALNWSLAVNREIEKLPDELKIPFEGASEGLEAAHRIADVAVVSSANRDAVELEWKKWGLLDHVDVLCCQDSGSKAFCIQTLREKGYAANHILMVGDAPGDQAAAKKNGVYFYPILVNHEKESWKELANNGLEKFRNEDFESYEEEKAELFLKNLSDPS